jgi:hypothetical protein
MCTGVASGTCYKVSFSLSCVGHIIICTWRRAARDVAWLSAFPAGSAFICSCLRAFCIELRSSGINFFTHRLFWIFVNAVSKEQSKVWQIDSFLIPDSLTEFIIRSPNSPPQYFPETSSDLFRLILVVMTFWAGTSIQTLSEIWSLTVWQLF